MSDKSRFRRGDFENRQRQLPADKRARKAKGAAWQKARTDQERTPIGSPPKPVDVRSVYDTRPVNAFDFNIPASAATVSTSSSSTVFFQVPEGFIAVLRNFDIWFEPNPVGVNRSNFTWSLQLNGGDYPYNIGVPFGIGIDRETVFLLANEFNTIGLRISTVAPGVFVAGFAFARFYGNFLLKSGLPPSLEIGNLVPKSAITPPRQSKSMSVPPARQPELMPTPSVNVRAAPPWKIEITRAKSSEASKNKAPLARLLVNQNGKQRLPTPQELIDYADLFEAAKRSQPANTRWY